MKRILFATIFLVTGGLLGGLAAGPLQGLPTITNAAGDALLGQAKHQKPAPLLVPQENSSYRDVVKTILPAVVSIEVKGKQLAKKDAPKIKPQIPDFDDFPIPDEFRKFFKDIPRESFKFEMPDVEPRQGFGSGFIVDPNGVIMTNHHVIAGAETVEVHLHDGQKFIASEIRSDPKTDLAVLRIKSEKPLPYLEFGNSDNMEIGDRVLAVGAPFGLLGTVTHGIVSSKGRHFDPNKYEDFIQTDAAINPGNSGGPLVNLKGSVIGVNTLIKTRSGGFQGIGMAISGNLAKHVMTELLDQGRVRRGYLGVQIKTLDADIAERLGIADKKGVLVTQVMDNSPAAEAGLNDGDVITKLNKQPVTSGWELAHRVALLPLDEPVDVQIVRDGKPQTVQVKIREQPKDFAMARPTQENQTTPKPKGTNLTKLGFTIADVTPQLAAMYGYTGDVTGAIVTRVEEDGLAALAGLTEGTLILQVNRNAVRSEAEAREALEKANLAEGILLQTRTAQLGVGYILLRSGG